jgi:hypothetical protein
MAYSLETVKQIFDDDTGDHIDIGPDRDGLGLLEMRYYIGTAIIPTARIAFTWEEGRLIVDAIHALLRDR